MARLCAIWTLAQPFLFIKEYSVTAIVALTASDIYDDCQTLIDLDELNINFDHEKNDEAILD